MINHPPATATPTVHDLRAIAAPPEEEERGHDAGDPGA
jgi:hypothetical protein